MKVRLICDLKISLYPRITGIPSHLWALLASENKKIGFYAVKPLEYEQNYACITVVM